MADKQQPVKKESGSGPEKTYKEKKMGSHQRNKTELCESDNFFDYNYGQSTQFNNDQVQIIKYLDQSKNNKVEIKEALDYKIQNNFLIDFKYNQDKNIVHQTMENNNLPQIQETNQEHTTQQSIENQQSSFNGNEQKNDSKQQDNYQSPVSQDANCQAQQTQQQPQTFTFNTQQQISMQQQQQYQMQQQQLQQIDSIQNSNQKCKNQNKINLIINKISSQRLQTQQPDVESQSSIETTQINSAREPLTNTPQINSEIDKDYGKPNKNYFNLNREKFYQFFDKFKNLNSNTHKHLQQSISELSKINSAQTNIGQNQQFKLLLQQNGKQVNNGSIVGHKRQISDDHLLLKKPYLQPIHKDFLQAIEQIRTNYNNNTKQGKIQINNTSHLLNSKYGNNNHSSTNIKDPQLLLNKVISCQMCGNASTNSQRSKLEKIDLKISGLESQIQSLRKKTEELEDQNQLLIGQINQINEEKFQMKKQNDDIIQQMKKLESIQKQNEETIRLMKQQIDENNNSRYTKEIKMNQLKTLQISESGLTRSMQLSDNSNKKSTISVNINFI